MHSYRLSLFSIESIAFLVYYFFVFHILPSSDGYHEDPIDSHMPSLLHVGHCFFAQ